MSPLSMKIRAAMQSRCRDILDIVPDDRDEPLQLMMALSERRAALWISSGISSSAPPASIAAIRRAGLSFQAASPASRLSSHSTLKQLGVATAPPALSGTAKNKRGRVV